MAKSAVFGVMHLGIAFAVSYVLTGSVTIAGAITLVEPVVNTVAHYFFDRWWEGGRGRRPSAGDGGHQHGLALARIGAWARRDSAAVATPAS